MDQVVCTAAHPVDLDDGRSLLPGETADVDTSNPANALLVDNGMITVTGSSKQGKKQNEEDKS